MTARGRKRLKISAIILIALLVAGEVYLRVGLGFCGAVLFREDEAYEYIPLPQSTRRLGNHISYNSFSQRNAEIPADTSTIIIDGLGDSVINGGSQLDDDSLATTRLGAYLSSKWGKPVLVTNISSQSWGPDNCYAYIKKHGDFNARSMFLVLSSHDLYDNMTFKKVVGDNPSFPDRQYKVALWELVDRYVLPRIFKSKASDEGAGINKRQPGSVMNPGILSLAAYAREKSIPFLVYHHADRAEHQAGKYNADGLTLDSLCRANGIRVIDELDTRLPETIYRDNIHMSAAGQLALFNILRDEISLSGKASVPDHSNQQHAQ